MNVRTKLAVALATLAAPLAAFASSSPATAGQVEAAERSGEIVSPASAPTPDLSLRVHELVVHGASYNEAPVEAAEPAARQAAEPGAASQPTRDALEQGAGYTPSSYAASAPVRG